MKTINFPNQKAEGFKEIMTSLIGASPEAGYTIDEVRLGIKILDKLQEAGVSLDLEDAEYSFAKNRVANARWKIASPEIVEFVDVVMNPV